MTRQAYGYRDEKFFELKILSLHDKTYAFVGWTTFSSGKTFPICADTSLDMLLTPMNTGLEAGEVCYLHLTQTSLKPHLDLT